MPLSDLSLFACAGYKGLRGPRGVAYAVTHDDVIGDFAVPSGYGMADGDVQGNYGPPLRPKRGAPGLDQSPAWLAWVGAEPGLAELAEQSATHRERHVVALAGRLRDNLEELNLQPQQTDLPSPIVSFASDEPAELVGRLGYAGVRATSKFARVRLGFHIYNDDNDVDIVSQALSQHIGRGRTARLGRPSKLTAPRFGAAGRTKDAA